MADELQHCWSLVFLHFVFFLLGNFIPFLLLRNNNDLYLGETKEVTMQKGEECSWLYCEGWGVSLGGAEPGENWAGERGTAPGSLGFGGEGPSCCCCRSPARPLVPRGSLCLWEQPLNRDLIGTLPH